MSCDMLYGVLAVMDNEQIPVAVEVVTVGVVLVLELVLAGRTDRRAGSRG